MHARKREFDKSKEELEDRMYRISDEADTFKRQHEKLDRENFELKKQVDSFISKEDRTIQQYEKILDQLKAEVKDKERQCHTIETREAYARQELNQRIKELEFRIESGMSNGAPAFVNA